MYIFILALQVSIPYLVRETIVFGVTVPDQNVKHPLLKRAKKRYAQIVGIVGLTLLMIMLAINLSVTVSASFTGDSIQLIFVYHTCSKYGFVLGESSEGDEAEKG